MSKNAKAKEADQRWLERLNQHPKLKERFRAILELAESEDGAMRTADEIEALLIEEVRQLGAETMGDWARGVKARVEAEVPLKYPGSHRSKKNG